MAMNANKWQGLLDQLNTSSSFYRPKEGKTRLRLIRMPEMGPDDGQPFQFYREVQTSFRGKAKTRYVIPALVLSGTGARPEMATTVTAVVVSKTVIKGILGVLAEDYELFGENAHGITISRTGQGLDTDYAVTASKAPIPLPEEGLEEPTQTLEEMAAAFEAWSNRSGGAADEEGDADLSAPPSNRRPGGRRRQSLDEGAEW